MAISPTPTFTVSLDSASSQCSGKAVRNLIPKSAPTNVHVNTIIPTIVASTVLLPTFSGVLLLCLNAGRIYTFHCRRRSKRDFRAV